MQSSVLDVGATKVPAAQTAEEARAAECGCAPAAEAKKRAAARRANESKAKPKRASAAVRRAAEFNPLPPGAASGARAAAALLSQGPEPVTENGCPMCGSPFSTASRSAVSVVSDLAGVLRPREWLPVSRQR